MHQVRDDRFSKYRRNHSRDDRHGFPSPDPVDPYQSAPFDNSFAGGTDSEAQSLRFPSLLGMPILESPAVANIGAGNVVGIVGDFSHGFVARFPADSFSIQRLEERYAEFGEVGFIGYSRADGVVGLTAACQILKCHA